MRARATGHRSRNDVSGLMSALSLPCFLRRMRQEPSIQRALCAAAAFLAFFAGAGPAITAPSASPSCFSQSLSCPARDAAKRRWASCQKESLTAAPPPPPSSSSSSSATDCLALRFAAAPEAPAEAPPGRTAAGLPLGAAPAAAAVAVAALLTLRLPPPCGAPPLPPGATERCSGPRPWLSRGVFVMLSNSGAHLTRVNVSAHKLCVRTCSTRTARAERPRNASPRHHSPPARRNHRRSAPCCTA